MASYTFSFIPPSTTSLPDLFIAPDRASDKSCAAFATYSILSSNSLKNDVIPPSSASLIPKPSLKIFCRFSKASVRLFISYS